MTIGNSDAAPEKRKLRFAAIGRLHANWRMLAGIGVATVLLMLAVFFAWQAWLVMQAESGDAQARRLRESGVVSIATQIAQTRTQVEQALTEASVQQALTSAVVNGEKPATESPGDGSVKPIDAYGQVATLLKQTLPQLSSIEVYDATLRAVLSADLRKFGYARAAVLTRAQSSRKATPVQVRRHETDATFMQAWPVVGADQSVLAIVLVQWPAQPVLDAFAAQPLSGARLELRQGDGRDDEVLAWAGSDHGSSADDPGLPIAGTRLRIGKADSMSLIMLSSEPSLLIGSALLCLLGAALALILRKFGLQQALAALRPKSRSSEPELTLAETMKRESAPIEEEKVAAVAAKARPLKREV
ncbi:MAG: hypothetical protein ABI451_13535, partial [Dokdonella sp.]